ncbi:radical SAM protein [Spirochaetia bacterium]|nr:radical SAM protein [Spirochaetia bacterium]
MLMGMALPISHAPDLPAPCGLCPRNCGADRVRGGRGFCGETAELRIAAASIHRGEEPPITGRGGSGTVFITGCTLGCGFCQNWQVSRNGMGRVVSEGEFVRICLILQERGVENINLVTGSHAVPALVRGIGAARRRGLTIPVLWNSSAYEGPEALSLLRDTVDVYLPDLKTLDSEIARRFFGAPDYPEAAASAIRRMIAMRGELRYGPGEVLVSGCIIRHLVLPGFLESTREVLRWFADHAQGRALLSLMTQYTPVHPDGAPRDAPPENYLNHEEYDRVLEWLEEFDIEDGFCQELVTDNGWLPDFNRQNPFSARADPSPESAAPADTALSTPVWHWREGFVEPGKL